MSEGARTCVRRWSPGCSAVSKAELIAAMPLLTAIAASVPSRLASFAASATWLGVSAQGQHAHANVKMSQEGGECLA